MVAPITTILIISLILNGMKIIRNNAQEMQDENLIAYDIDELIESGENLFM